MLQRRTWFTRPFGAIVGYTIAAVCLVWVFHDVQFGSVWRSVREMRWTLLAVAIGLDVGSYAVQGLRWRLLLRPVGPFSWIDSTQAIYAGLFANELLPMRPGELLRAYTAARRLGSDIASVVPSIVVERLFDGLWLAAGVGVTAMFVPLPPSLAAAGDVLGVVILLASAAFAFAVLARPDASWLRWRGAGWLNRMRSGAREIVFGREAAGAFALSAALLALQILSFWMVMRAYRLDAAIWVAAAALIIIRLGTVVPNAPANVGTYQFFCVVGLMLFGIDKSLAGGFSVVVFAVLTVPLWLLGSIAVARTGVTLGPAGPHQSKNAPPPSGRKPSRADPYRAGGVALLAAVLAYIAGTTTEIFVIKLLQPSEIELTWISDAILAVAFGLATFLWLRLKWTRLALSRLEREHIVIDTQLALAAQIQRGLLPAALPADEHLRSAARLEQAGRIGGDLYDFVAHAPRTWLVLVGDVSGKGIPAALVHASVRTMFRLMTARTSDPGELVARISQALFEDNGGAPYLTCLVARIDLDKREIGYVNAGHPPAVMLDGSNLRGPRWLLESNGPPAGMFDGQRYRTTSLPLPPRAIAVLVTDGITEAFDELGLGGKDAIPSIVTALPEPISPDRICDALIERTAPALSEDGTGWQDDRTVVAFLVG